jgi:hypothetical protein
LIYKIYREKKMFIRVYDWGRCHWDNYRNEAEVGLRFASYGRIEVTNKKVFMLAVLNYGIEFKEVKY